MPTPALNLPSLRRAGAPAVKSAALALAALSVSWSAHASLVAQWVGDAYVSGNWTDSSGLGHTGNVIGTVGTSTTGFNGHKSLSFLGGDGGGTSGFFSVTNDGSLLNGATAMTLAAVFSTPVGNTSVGGQFWQKAGLIGNEQGGSVADWGLGFGAQQADFGIGGADTTIVSANLTLSVPHIAIGVWSSTGTMTLYVDGAQVAQNTAAPTAARTAGASFGLGANESAINGDTHVFSGQVAELRAYNDATTDPTALYNSLRAAYVVPEPGSAALLSLGVVGLLGRRRRS